jgi:hypothetical protein
MRVRLSASTECSSYYYTVCVLLLHYRILQALTMEGPERTGRRARDLPYIASRPSAEWTYQVKFSVIKTCTYTDDSATGYCCHA